MSWHCRFFLAGLWTAIALAAIADYLTNRGMS
jgi:hypothetical protein